MRISRRIEFDAGHRIVGHKGKCANLHGHRYIAEIVVCADRLDDLGMVVDFGVIKNEIGTWIEQNWDHNMLLHKDDLLLLRDHADVFASSPYSFQENPTAENIAKELFGVCERLLPEQLRIDAVKIWETPNCWAMYERSGD